MKRTKIVATIGPASADKEILKQLIESGMNVARLNFSHGEHEWHSGVIDTIRELSMEMGVNVAILGDLQGPRIRTRMAREVIIEAGETILIGVEPEGGVKSNEIDGKKIIYFDYKELMGDIKSGESILIEDGLMKVELLKKNGDFFEAKVIDGGTVKNHKGVNAPETKLSIDPITEKDENDLEFLMKKDVEFVALSFVGSAQEVRNLKEKIKNYLGRDYSLPKVVVKLERKEAISNMEEIIRESDVVMVARGDLGIEMEESRVTLLQKEIIKKSIFHLKPVIVATQMLDSMINNPRPTRAEVSDVTNAVIDSADAVMLSGETAGGKYPVRTVQFMTDIIRKTEESSYDDIKKLDRPISSDLPVDNYSVVRSAIQLARDINAKGIFAFTRSGFTANMVSHFRQEKLIYAATNNEKVYKQLAIIWGVNAFYAYGEPDEDVKNYINQMMITAKNDGRIQDGDKVIIILGRTKDSDDMSVVVTSCC